MPQDSLPASPEDRSSSPLESPPRAESASERTRVRRAPARGRYDRETIDSILDEALVCHVAYVDDGQPFVIPTLGWRQGDWVYLHGSQKSRMLDFAARGEPLCVTFTLIDGLVLARSAFHHSVNYRSVVLLGRAEEVVDAEAKGQALVDIIEHIAPGRSRSCRLPSDEEVQATRVVRLAVEEASAKVRTGPPKDDREDYALAYWAGVLPLGLRAGDPIPDPELASTIPLPVHVASHPFRQS